MKYMKKLILKVHDVCENINDDFVSSDINTIIESEENGYWVVNYLTVPGIMDTVIIEFAGIHIWDSENYNHYNEEDIDPGDPYKTLEDFVRGEIKKVICDLLDFKFCKDIKI